MLNLAWLSGMIQQKQKVIQSSTTSTTITNNLDTFNYNDDEYLSSEKTSEDIVKQNMYEQKKFARNLKMTLITNK